MKHGSLFSGIGGFDLAAEWMGWDNVFHCEWNEFGQKILKYYWPNAISYDDITKTDFTKHRGTIDILTGGFPCQPYSTAGKRLGKEDDRHLWPEMLRAIREIQPRWVVGENVRGLINWSEGLVFEEVQTQLEAEGYEVQPFLLPSCGVGAPHRRDRIWFVAHSNCNVHSGKLVNGRYREEEKGGKGEHKSKRKTSFGKRIWFKSGSGGEIITNSHGQRIQRGETSGYVSYLRKNIKEQFRGYHKPNDWRMFPTQSPVCNGNDGISSELDGITFPKWRQESIKGGGNAIVPQVAYKIFKSIEQYENNV